MKKVAVHADAFIVLSICAPQWNRVQQQQCVPKPQAVLQPFVMARAFIIPQPLSVCTEAMYRGRLTAETLEFSLDWEGNQFIFAHICLLS